jgi:hypothetical protein
LAAVLGFDAVLSLIEAYVAKSATTQPANRLQRKLFGGQKRKT